MSPQDTIELRGVRARGHHGVLDFERRDGQDFVVDVIMHLDLAPAATSDDLTTSVSYAEVAADVIARVEGPASDLIETLAGRIADDVLRRPRVEAVEVTVHKPEAPVGVPFGDVAVTLRRERRIPVVIAVGANLESGHGRPEDTIGNIGELLRVDGLEVVAQSAMYRTAPVGGPEQPDYVNAVVLATTSMSPWRLLETLHRVEAALGRTREVRWGPRTLDLDLVQYGDPRDGSEVVSDDPALTLPHPRAHERAFVLVPWLAADPAATLRVGDEAVEVSELVEAVGSEGVVPVEPA